MIGLEIIEVKKKMPILELTKKDLDTKGNFIFTEGSLQKRGGFPYYQPSAPWKRIGLNVKSKYDNENDDWLKMDGNEREWAVAFHGIRGLQTFVGQGVIDKGLLAGPNQAYRNDRTDSE